MPRRRAYADESRITIGAQRLKLWHFIALAGAFTTLSLIFGRKTIMAKLGSNPYLDDFVKAARTAGVPESWASNPALIELVKHESNWKLDADNPTSTAFGLFQFLKGTWGDYLKEVPYMTVSAYWQAVGGFRYIKARYGTPDRAWAFWQATVKKNPSLAPPDLVATAQSWVSKGHGGY